MSIRPSGIECTISALQNVDEICRRLLLFLFHPLFALPSFFSDRFSAVLRCFAAGKIEKELLRPQEKQLRLTLKLFFPLLRSRFCCFRHFCHHFCPLRGFLAAPSISGRLFSRFLSSAISRISLSSAGYVFPQIRLFFQIKARSAEADGLQQKDG